MAGFPSIPGFTLDAELGRGGMAVVYAATDDVLGRKVAIKVVSPHGADADQYIRRLEQEALGLASLQHPNIVELHTFGRTADDSLYYVMPLLKGGDLARRSKPLGEAQLASLLEALLHALAHAHSVGIVHRDIKPENILFDQYERPLLADFGAAFVRGASRLTTQGMVVGSSHYMSPEQARGLDVDARSDLYSLGVLAFEYLTGELPFRGNDDLAIALAKLEQPVPRLPAGIAHWQSFFDRSLAVDREQRFASADAMRAALPAAVSAAPRRSVRRFGPRHWAIGGVLAAGLVLAMALWFALGSSRAVTLESIEQAIAAERWAPPAADNAVDLLARAREDASLDPESLAPLRRHTLDALGERAVLALEDDPVTAPDVVRTWALAVERLDARNHPSAVATRRALEAAIARGLDRAEASQDRALAASALALLDAWDAAPPELVARREAIAKIRSIGDRFADAAGPELVLAVRATQDRPALAIMRAPVDPLLYRRFASARGETPRDCDGAPANVQGCIGAGDAEAIADWLSETTGARYRLPSRVELEDAREHVEPAPVRAWTATCRERRIAQEQSVARRTWSGVRRVFGRSRLPQRVVVRCDGNYTVSLDGADADVQQAAAPDTVVVLVREMGRVGTGVSRE